MSRDTRVVAVALLVCVATLASASVLMGAINTERKSLDLVVAEIEGLPPKIAIAQVALGSFRGLLNDVLWARAHQLEQAGRYHEAMNLGKWISQLQPHYPQVWQFRAFNMTYNISVATHTGEERYRWVDGGLRLLRDEALAIPRNRSALGLYVELARIYVDKLADSLDDFHWHYKQQIAREWQVILGEPPGEGTTEAFAARLERLRDLPETVEALTQDPETGAAVGEQLLALRKAGYTLDWRLLHHLIQVEELLEFDKLGYPIPAEQRERFTKILEWLEPAGGQAARTRLIDFTRASLIRERRLDLGKMIELTREVGPLDWRHPATHGLYWAIEGRRVHLANNNGRNRTEEQNFWDLHRMLLRAAKHLVLRGDVVFDYITGYIRHLPDPQFFPYHEKVVQEAIDSVPAEYEGVRDGFKLGRKNFLIWAAWNAWYYGDEAQARELYKTLAIDHPEDPAFQRPIEMFLWHLDKDQLLQASGDIEQAGQKIGGFLAKAIQRGIGTQSLDVYRKFVAQASRIRAEIMKIANDPDVQAMPSIQEMLDNEYVKFMLQPKTASHPLIRHRMWRATPLDIRQRTYKRLIRHLARDAERAGMDVEKMYPRPPGAKD